MANRNSIVKKTKPRFQSTDEIETKRLNYLPMRMAHVKTMIDPYNDKNYFIFGSQNFENNNECWYYNHETHSFNKINDIPRCQGRPVSGHACAMFEAINDGNTNKYGLIYRGSSFTPVYSIYEFKTKQWNEIALQINKQWVKNNSDKYMFGSGLSMITDLFAKNKIHIIGGQQSYNKYGYFEFNEEILNNRNLSFVSYNRFCLNCENEKTTKIKKRVTCHKITCFFVRNCAKNTNEKIKHKKRPSTH